MERILTVIDLFAGVGGFSQGFLKANRTAEKYKFNLRLLVDSDPTAAFTFKRNMPTVPYWRQDLSVVDSKAILKLAKVRVGELDFLIGGPPCQGFSPSGKRWLEDNRNKLLSQFIDIAHQVMPKCVIIENVPAALSAYKKLFNEEVEEAFKGYVVESEILNASQFGVPQIRKRAFVVALRKDLGIGAFDFPCGNFDAIHIGNDAHTKAKSNLKFVPVADAIGDLPSIKAGESVDGAPYSIEPTTEYQRERRQGSVALFNHRARAHTKDFLKKIGLIRPGKGNATLPEGKRFSDNYYSQAYARLHARGIAFTITANFRNPGSGRFTHYNDKRSLTVREAARLQSFDDWFIFHGYETDQERHVGNAVPPLLAEALARHFGTIVSLT